MIKNDKIQIIDLTDNNLKKIGSNLLQKWKIGKNNENYGSEVGSFSKSTKTICPTGNSGGTSLPPIGDSYMSIETSSNKLGSDNVFCSSERRDIIQITQITFS